MLHLREYDSHVESWYAILNLKSLKYLIPHTKSNSLITDFMLQAKSIAFEYIIN